MLRELKLEDILYFGLKDRALIMCLLQLTQILIRLHIATTKD